MGRRCRNKAFQCVTFVRVRAKQAPPVSPRLGFERGNDALGHLRLQLQGLKVGKHLSFEWILRLALPGQKPHGSDGSNQEFRIFWRVQGSGHGISP
jgi:hypothetical protein